MRISSKHILAIISFALIVGVFSVQETNAQIKNRILKTMEAHKNALQSLKANVKMVEFEGTLGDITERSGVVHYLPRPGKDAYVRIDWKDPIEMLLVADGRYMLYRKVINQAIVGDVNKSTKQKGTSNSLKFMSMSKKELDDNYHIQYLGKPKVAGQDVWHLKLTPKGKESFVEAQLWVDGNGMPVQAMIKQKNKDRTTIRLSSLEKNITIKASVFAPKLPKEVKRVKG
jgi:outer membrane lipoprotein-sorting protein